MPLAAQYPTYVMLSYRDEKAMPCPRPHEPHNVGPRYYRQCGFVKILHGHGSGVIPGKVLMTRSRPIRARVSLVCQTPPPWKNRPASNKLSNNGLWVSSNRARQRISPSRALIRYASYATEAG